MKILVVSHEFPPIGGGGANACLFLTKGYVEAGHSVTVVTVWYEGLKEYEVLNGVEIYRVRSKRAHKEHCSFMEMLSYIMKAIPLTTRLQKEQKYDICQVFFGIPSGVIGYWLKLRFNLPYIIRFGGGDIPGFQERFNTIYKLIGPFIKIIWRNANALVANSKGLKEMAMRFYDKNEIEIITNGVDTKFFHPIQKDSSDTFEILFVSRLIERKGLQYVIPQIKELQGQIEKKIRLTIVGDGPYRKMLGEKVKENGLTDLVRFEGQKDKDEIVSYYQQADLFILPSTKEGMPNVVLEAMACGLPIVITPCEGSMELVSDNGVIVAKEMFGNAIKTLIEDEESLLQKGKKSRLVIEQKFSWDMIVKRYERVLLKAIED